MEVWVKKLKIKNDKGKLEWQKRLLVISQKRLFIVMEKPGTECLEIVDSIPLQEITSVDILSQKKIQKVDTRSFSIDMSTSFTLVEEWAQTAAGGRKSPQLNALEESPDAKDKNRKLQDYYDTLLTLNAPGQGGVLRITTLPDGFNDGQPYYFTDFVAVQKLRGADDKNSSRALPSDLQTVEDELQRLSRAYAKVFARDTRFERLQASLRRVWNSVWLNTAILAFIVANFVCTIRGLENRDPRYDALYERVDLFFTVIFTVGARHCSLWANCKNCGASQKILAQFSQIVKIVARQIVAHHK